MALSDGYGLHELVWNVADEVVSDVLVASPMDADGRGIDLFVRERGRAAELTGAVAYLVWTHRHTGKRGTTLFEAVDASVGHFQVYYPAAMCGAAGVVDAAVVLSLGENRYVSTRTFQIRVERVLVDGLEPEDGFTLFVQAMAAYENVNELSTEAVTNANAAAEAANSAAETANSAASTLLARAEAGEFDGAQGEVGPQGPKGDKGDTGEQGPKGDKGDTGETGPKGDRGDDGADGVSVTHSWDGTVLTVTSASGTSSADLVGPQGARGERGPQGPAGEGGGTTFTPVEPLALSEDGELTVDLSGCEFASDTLGRVHFADGGILGISEGTTGTTTADLGDAGEGDLVCDLASARVYRVLGSDEEATSLECVLDLKYSRRLMTTTELDAKPGSVGTATIDVGRQPVAYGTLVLNTRTGNLMMVTAPFNRPDEATARVTAWGLANIFNSNVEGGSGTTFTPVAPLALSDDGELSVDLSAYLVRSKQHNVYDVTSLKVLPAVDTSVSPTYSSGFDVASSQRGDLAIDYIRDRVALINYHRESGDSVTVGFETRLDLADLRGVIVTDELDAAEGETASGRIGRKGHALAADTLVLNTETGNLMRVTAAAIPVNDLVKPDATVVGLGNVYNANVSGGGGGTGAGITAVEPLALSEGGELSIDTSGLVSADDELGRLHMCWNVGNASEGATQTAALAHEGLSVGDLVWDARSDLVARVTAIADGRMTTLGVLDLRQYRSFVTTSTIDITPGQYASAQLAVGGHAVAPSTVIFNYLTGNLMRVRGSALGNRTGASATVGVEGLCNLYASGTAPDLSGYAQLSGADFTGAVTGLYPHEESELATKGYVDGEISTSMSGLASQEWVEQQIQAAINALDDLSEEEF